MEYRQLGNSGLKVSVLTMGTMTFGGKGNSAKTGNLELKDVRKLHRHVADAGVNLIDTANVYSERRVRGLYRRGDGRQAQARHADRNQGALSDGGGAERPGPLPLAPHPRMRGEPEAAANRRHRPLSGASVGRPDAARGNHGGARQPRARGQGPLRRLLELFRLACDEGARGRAPRRPHAFVSEQIHYTLQAREAEYELIPIPRSGLGILVWSPLAGGLLSRQAPAQQEDRRRLRHLAGWKEPPILDEDKLWDIVDVLVAIARGARRLGGAGRARLAARRPA